MRLVRIIRTVSLRANEMQKDFFEAEEKNKHLLVLRPGERSNKNLPKESIMNPTCSIDMGSTHLFAAIWCFDYQEKEAEEILEEAVNKSFSKEEGWLKKQIENLSTLSNRSKTEINIMY